jgi:hypothetical protein
MIHSNLYSMPVIVPVLNIQTELNADWQLFTILNLRFTSEKSVFIRILLKDELKN